MKISVLGTRGFPMIQGGVENIVNHSTHYLTQSIK